MKFDFSELNGEQLLTRKDELLAGLDNPETRDALSTDDLEARMGEIQAIDTEIEARKAAAAEERQVEPKNRAAMERTFHAVLCAMHFQNIFDYGKSDTLKYVF